MTVGSEINAVTGTLYFLAFFGTTEELDTE